MLPAVRVALVLAGACLLAGAAGAHPALDPSFMRAKPVPATREELATAAALLGRSPVQAVSFDGILAVAVLPAPKGRQAVAVIDLYLKGARRMPGLLAPGVRVTNIHLRGDLVAFQADGPTGSYDYLWDSEEPGPPYWKRTPIGPGEVTYSPNVASSLVARFYLQDPLMVPKVGLAEALRKALFLRDVVYIDGAVLVLSGNSPTENAALRWADDEWVDAGPVTGVVNHHAMADLNGDGMIEMLVGDSQVDQLCIRSWSRLYTWNADKTRVVATDIRAESAFNLSGACAHAVPACFREESLTWNRAVLPWPVLTVEGTRDTTGCPGTQLPAERASYRRRFAWNPAHAAFEEAP